MPSEDPRINYWMFRTAYRQKFGLTSSEMDREPLEEVMIVQHIWKCQSERERIEQLRSEQQNERSAPN